MSDEVSKSEALQGIDDAETNFILYREGFYDTEVVGKYARAIARALRFVIQEMPDEGELDRILGPLQELPKPKPQSAEGPAERRIEDFLLNPSDNDTETDPGL